MLMYLVNMDGPINWVRIAGIVGGRSAKQCRERYHQNLKPTLNHAPITPEEAHIINTLVGQIGKRWAEIARHLDNRSDNAVKNWWNGNQNRMKRRENRGAEHQVAHRHRKGSPPPLSLVPHPSGPSRRGPSSLPSPVDPGFSPHKRQSVESWPSDDNPRTSGSITPDRVSGYSSRRSSSGFLPMNPAHDPTTSDLLPYHAQLPAARRSSWDTGLYEPFSALSRRNMPGPRLPPLDPAITTQLPTAPSSPQKQQVPEEQEYLDAYSFPSRPPQSQYFHTHYLRDEPRQSHPRSMQYQSQGYYQSHGQDHGLENGRDQEQSRPTSRPVDSEVERGSTNRDTRMSVSSLMN